MPIHPFIIHFAIALYTISFLFDLTAKMTAKKELQSSGFLTLILSGISVLLAVASGLWEKSRITIPENAAATFELHENLAFAVSAIILIQMLWRIGIKNRFTKNSWKLFMVLYTAGLMSLYLTAFNGGKLVYRYGTGLRLEKPSTLMKSPTSKDSGKIEKNDLFYPYRDTTIQKENNGSDSLMIRIWKWKNRSQKQFQSIWHRVENFIRMFFKRPLRSEQVPQREFSPHLLSDQYLSLPAANIIIQEWQQILQTVADFLADLHHRKEIFKDYLMFKDDEPRICRDLDGSFQTG